MKKIYESPVLEVFEVECANQMLATSDPDQGIGTGEGGGDKEVKEFFGIE